MSGFLLDVYPAASTIYALFHSFDSTGASVTLTGLAAGDIEIFKNGSVTQRSSDNGYTLLDTDGIDFDSRTGIHGVSIDLNDNTDAGFYAVGAQYTVVIDAVTIDSQTVRFVLGSFTITDALDVSDVHSLLTKVYSDTTITETKLGEGDTSDILSRLTVTNSQLLIVKSDTSDIKSALVIVLSDIAEVDTSDIQSQLTKVYSDTTRIEGLIGEGDFSDILSRLTVTNSQLVVVKSDVAHIESDAVRIESMAVVIKSDTSDVISALVKVYSDTTAIHSDTTIVETKLGEADFSDIQSMLTKVYSDTTVLTGSRAEPGQGAPAATTDTQTKIDYLYKAMRNKHTQSTTEFKLYGDDASTVDQKATVSDDGSTFTRGEIGSGP